MGILQKSLGDGFYSFSKGHWGLQLHGKLLYRATCVEQSCLSAVAILPCAQRNEPGLPG